MKTIETKAAKFEVGKTYYTTWRKSDGCEQIITCTIEKRTAHSVTINGKRHMIPRIDGTLTYPDIEYILVTADDGWKVHVDARNIYAAEEIVGDNADEETIGITDADIVEATTVTGKVNGALSADPNADNFTEAKFITYAHAKDPHGINYAIRSTDFARAEHALTLYKDALADKAAEYEFGISHADNVADADLVTRAENKNARDLTAEERDALFAGWRAQTLSDPAIDAAYQKAKQIVKVDIRAGGNRWHVQKKNGEWTLNMPYAMKRLYECGITDTDFIIKAKHDVPSGDKIEGATAQSVEETAPEIDPDEYIITQEAFDEAIEAEEFEAYCAEMDAKILADPIIDATYRKATERIEVQFTKYGAPLYTYIKKNGERCHDERVAKCYIGKCGLRETDFIIKARAEETVCDLTDKLRKATRKADYMTLTTQSGEELISRFGNVRVQPDGGGFIITNGHETLARYDTKEQCEFVIDWIKKTVAGGGNEFEFPTAEFAALEMHAYELLLRHLKANYRYIGRHYWQMRIGDKWRNAPRRFMAADLKYYGLTPAQLKEAYHA